jgi:hypothetical protein
VLNPSQILTLTVLAIRLSHPEWFEGQPWTDPKTGWIGPLAAKGSILVPVAGWFGFLGVLLFLVFLRRATLFLGNEPLARRIGWFLMAVATSPAWLIVLGLLFLILGPPTAAHATLLGTFLRLGLEAGFVLWLTVLVLDVGRIIARPRSHRAMRR